MQLIRKLKEKDDDIVADPPLKYCFKNRVDAALA